MKEYRLLLNAPQVPKHLRKEFIVERNEDFIMICYWTAFILTVVMFVTQIWWLGFAVVGTLCMAWDMPES